MISASAPTSGTSLRGLAEHRPDHRVRAALQAQRTWEWRASLGANFRAVPRTLGHYSISEQISLPLAVKRERVDLFHAPHYVLPALTPARTVVTIHDCIHLMFPRISEAPPGSCVRARVAVDRRAQVGSHLHGLRAIQARHPEVLQGAAGQDRRDAQRHRRSLQRRSRAKSTCGRRASGIS